MSARPGPRGGYCVSGIPTAIVLTVAQCIMKERPRFRRSKPDEAPPPLRCAVQGFAPLRRR
jgi:hypothetical protein